MASHSTPHPSDHQTPPTRTGSEPADAPNITDAVLLYTPAEAAQLLQVRESWLRRKAAAREVACTFLGKHLRFSPTDLTVIVAAAARPAGARRSRRRRPGKGMPGRDLPPPAQRSVHAHRDDHRSNGSNPWHG